METKPMTNVELAPPPAAPGSGGSSSSLLDRFRTLRTLWRDIATSWRSDDGVPVVRPDLPIEDMHDLRRQMQACLEGKGGEVSARARAAALGRCYMGLNAEGRARFLRLLATEYGPDPAEVDAAMAALRDAAPEQRPVAESRLRQVLEPPRLRLLTQFNALPDGVKFLVDLRAELLPLTRKDAPLASLETDLKALLSSWFDVGFLELRRLTWRSPACQLEKIIQYEAVHAIQSWHDLKNRLDSDRRLYGFFHPRMPDEPLIFVEVALVKGIADNVQELLDEKAPVTDPEQADTAIFYSISNAQKGLAGISFGNFLIKTVVDSLSHEFPNLKTFATLSPIPGFRAWLEERLAAGEPGLLLPAERKLVSAVGKTGAKGSLKALIEMPGWQDDLQAVEALRGPLTRLAARYLATAKKADGRALDPVAHFHLSNGARLERLNWMGDRSGKGIAQSCGLMVNYLYKLSDIDANHEAYTGQAKVAQSSAIKALIKS